MNTRDRQLGSWSIVLLLMLCIQGHALAQEGTTPASPGNGATPTWTRLVPLADGRRLVTDGALALDVAFAKPAVLPTTVVPEAGAALLAGYLTAPWKDEFGLADLRTGGSPPAYTAPTGVVLNATYVDYLRRTLPTARLRFRMRGGLDPIVILSNGTAVGVLMPMKQ